MAWSVVVLYDTDNAQIGTVQATFTYPDETTFAYSARVNRNLAGVNAFVTAAKAALSARDAFLAQKSTDESFIATKLNS